jgi:hypothetical protein
MTTLETASDIDAKDSTVLCMQGLSLMKLGRASDASAYFQRAVAANPGDQWATDLLARSRPAAAAPVETPTTAPGAEPEPARTITTAAPTAGQVIQTP